MLFFRLVQRKTKGNPFDRNQSLYPFAGTIGGFSEIGSFLGLPDFTSLNAWQPVITLREGCVSQLPPFGAITKVDQNHGYGQYSISKRQHRFSPFKNYGGTLRRGCGVLQPYLPVPFSFASLLSSYRGLRERGIINPSCLAKARTRHRYSDKGKRETLSCPSA